MTHKDSSAKDFFLHLLSSLTLYMSAIAFLMVTFQLINYLFPVDTSMYGYSSGYSSGILRAGISMLIIALPVFLGTRIAIGRMYTKEPARKEFKLRKWLMYFTLFAAAIIIIITLIFIVNTFLSGDLTSRFIFKALSTMAVAALVFSYYLIDVREKLTKANRTAYQWGTVLVSLALVIGTLFVVGSPSSARQAKLDTERVSGLSSLQSAIDTYYTAHETLPEHIDDIDTNTLYGDVTDPKTGVPYEYNKTGDTTYTVCATFETDTQDTSRRDSNNWWGKEWNHPVGHYCFEKHVTVYPTPEEIKAVSQ